MLWRLKLIVLLLLCSSCTAPSATVAQRLRAERLIDQGVLRLRAGAADSATAAFTLSYQLQPSAAALDGLGCAAFLQGDFQQAEQLFKRAQRVDPAYAAAAGNLALLYDILDRPQVAAQWYQRSLQQDPENFRVRNNFAVLLGSPDSPLANETWARRELLQAEVLAEHPLIQFNMTVIEENDYGQAKTNSD